MPVLLFDFDGTIANTLQTLIKVYNNKLARPFFCKPVAQEDIEFLKNQPYPYFAKAYGITFWKLPFLAAGARRLLRKEMDKIQPFENIGSQLRTLRSNNFQMGILSSNSKENILHFLKKNKMDGLFDFVQSEKSFFGKDKPLRRFLKKNNLAKDQLIYIGDEVRDIAAGKKVGIQTAAVTWGFHGKKMLEKAQPDFLFQNVEELLEFSGLKKIT